MSRTFKPFKFISTLVMVCILGSSIIAPAAQAAMVTSPDVIQQVNVEEKREALKAMFEREDVKKQLQAEGVSPEFAQQRVAAMTDAEVVKMSNDMENMPAGGVVGAIVFVFLVLLFTDIMGWTDIFPFVNKPAR